MSFPCLALPQGPQITEPLREPGAHLVYPASGEVIAVAAAFQTVLREPGTQSPHGED